MTPRTFSREHLFEEFAPWALAFSVIGILVWLGYEAMEAKRALVLMQTAHNKEMTQQTLGTIGRFMGLVSLGVFLLGVFFFFMIAYQIMLKKKYDRVIKILRQGHTRYKFLAEGPLSIGIMRIDCVSGRVIDANTGALRLFGLSRSEFVGKRLSRFLTEESVARMEKAIKKIQAGKKFFEVSCTILTTFGDTRDIDFHIAVPGGDVGLGDVGHSTREAVAILTDVTERRIAEEERLKNERLRGVLEMAGGAAHELNQPLQVVLAYADMISLEMADGNPLKEKVEKLRHEVERLSEISKKIASISEYSVRDYVGNVKIVDVNLAAKTGSKFPYKMSGKKERTRGKKPLEGPYSFPSDRS